MRRLAIAALLLGLGPAGARVPLVEGDTVTVDLGGYLRMFSAWQRIDEVPAPDLASSARLADPLELAAHASIARAELRASLGPRVTLEAHSRVQWNQGQATLVGAGVTPTPARTVDTESTLVEARDATLSHDLDRAVARLFLDGVDLSLGRQAITWGTGTLFRVADVWTQFSPFDVDTSQKRGVDAARAVVGLGDRAELDLLVVDRGALADLSGGARATVYLASADVYLAAAKVWEQLAVMGGVSAAIDAFKLRGEGFAAYDLDAGGLQRPRLTVAGDWFYSGDLILGLEGHYNGPGRDLEALARGELYLIGSWYGGAYLSYRPHELVTVSGATMVDVADPTALVSWAVDYAVQQDVDVGLGGFHGLGQGLEFGAYPQVVFLQVSAFL